MTPIQFRVGGRARGRGPSPQALYLRLAVMGLVLAVFLAVMLNPGLLYRVGLPREDAGGPPAARPDAPVRIIRIETQPADQGDTATGARPRAVSEPAATQPVGLPLGIDRAILNDVEDLRPIEGGPYFEALRAVRGLPAAAFSQEGLPAVTLSDLLREPARFRGRLVTVTGNLRRLEQQSLGENAAGLERVWEGQVRAEEGGFSTFVLVEAPPAGTAVGRDVALTGAFFKAWVYRDRRGTLRQSPLLMGRTLRLLQTAYPEQFRVPVALGTAVGVLLVIFLVLAVTVYRRGDRRFYRRFRVPRTVAPQPSGAPGAQPGAGAPHPDDADTRAQGTRSDDVTGEEAGHGDDQP